MSTLFVVLLFLFIVFVRQKQSWAASVLATELVDLLLTGNIFTVTIFFTYFLLLLY